MARSHLNKADRLQMKRHNHRLILRCIYQAVAHTRVMLAEVTHLARPTVSEIVAGLIEEGYLEEIGQGDSSPIGGKRPTLLRFVPDARQVITLTVDGYQIQGNLCYLDGQVVARHQLPLLTGETVTIDAGLRYVINALIAQLDYPRERPHRPTAPILCISLGVPGVVDHEHGIVLASPQLGWRSVPLAAQLQQQYKVPVYVANHTELIARAQMAYSKDRSRGFVVTVLMNHTIEIATAIQGQYYHHSSGAGYLPMGSYGEPLSSYLSWQGIKRRVNSLRSVHPRTIIPADEVTYLQIRYALLQGDSLAQQVFEEITDRLAELYAWIIAINRPDHVALVGHISDFGGVLLERLQAKVAARLPVEWLQGITFSLADADLLSMNGALANALQAELGLFEV